MYINAYILRRITAATLLIFPIAPRDQRDKYTYIRVTYREEKRDNARGARKSHAGRVSRERVRLRAENDDEWCAQFYDVFFHGVVAVRAGRGKYDGWVYTLYMRLMRMP